MEVICFLAIYSAIPVDATVAVAAVPMAAAPPMDDDDDDGGGAITVGVMLGGTNTDSVTLLIVGDNDVGL